jgi:hypothetical protein
MGSAKTGGTVGAQSHKRPYLLCMRLWCHECGRPSGAEAKGWRLCRLDVPDEDPEPLLLAYCPSCAAREFDSARRDEA